MSDGAIPTGLRILVAVASAPGVATTADVGRLADAPDSTVNRTVRRGYLDRLPCLGLVLTRSGRWIIRTRGIVVRTCQWCGSEFEVNVFGERTVQKYCSKQCCRDGREARLAAE